MKKDRIVREKDKSVRKRGHEIHLRIEGKFYSNKVPYSHEQASKILYMYSIGGTLALDATVFTKFD